MIYFTSDHHFGHTKIANLRGFATNEEHHTALIKNYCNVITEDDVVWLLGDLTLTRSYSKLSNIMSFLNIMPGRKRLITGNHDACWPGFRDFYKYTELYTAFEAIAPFARIKYNGDQYMLSHFPYVGDRGPERFTGYRLKEDGLPIIHGHTHSDSKFSYSMKSKQYHAGLDAWDLTPVSLESLISAHSSVG